MVLLLAVLHDEIKLNEASKSSNKEFQDLLVSFWNGMTSRSPTSNQAIIMWFIIILIGIRTLAIINLGFHRMITHVDRILLSRVFLLD